MTHRFGIKSAFLLILSVLAFSSAAFAQRPSNKIFVLDCTRSMSGYAGAPNIWADTKQFLQESLDKEAKSNPATSVVIIPFQHSNHAPIKVNLKNYDWRQIESALDGYQQRITDTNICDAWLEAEKHINPTHQNTIIFLTDGNDNIGGAANAPQRQEKLRKIIEAFCGKYPNTHAFYIQLTHAAQLPASVQQAIIDCEDIDIIEPQHVKWIAPRDRTVDINTRDLPKDITVAFTQADNFSAELIDSDNDFVTFTVVDGNVKKGKATIRVESKYGANIDKLNDAIGADGADLPLTFHSNDIQIYRPEIKVRLNAKPIRQLSVATDQEWRVAAAVDRVKPFPILSCPAPADTLCWDLAPAFNAEAAKDRASASFILHSAKDLSALTLLFNGESVGPDSSIMLQPGKPARVELVYPQGEDNDQFSLTLTEKTSRHLDRINDQHPDAAVIALSADVQSHRSMWEIIFWVIVGAIVLYIILWFAYLRDSLYPKFKRGVITVNSPNYATIPTQGCRMIVLTDKPKAQGLFDRAWRGKVQYHVNRAWTSECHVTPSGQRNMRFRCPGGGIASEPGATWTPGGAYTIRKTSDQTIIAKISIN